MQSEDQKAAKLAELLAWYIRMSIREGAELDEIAEWTVRELAADIEQTHPRDLPELPAEIRELAS